MIRIGKIVATHGLQGGLILTHVVGHDKWLKKGDVLFVEMNKQSFIPFFVSQIKSSRHDEFHIGLEDVATVEQAKKLVGKQVHVKEEMLEGHAAESPLAWIGFKLKDKTKGELGVVDDMMQTPTQWLATLMVEGKEVLVPLVEQTLLKVDIKNKTLHVDLPEGLLEVYLG
jgi:16S rRNA processing protein RimM